MADAGTHPVSRAPLRSRALLTGYVYLLMFVYAFSMTMIGPLMPDLVGHYRISLASGGLLVTFMSAGGVAAMLLGGALSDRASKARLIALCFLAYGLVLLLAGRGPRLGLLYVLFFALGASTRYMDVLANALVADVHADHKERALSLLHAIFGIGALVGPLYARLLADSTGSWTNAYTLLGAVGLAVLALGFPLLLAGPPAAARDPLNSAGTANGMSAPIKNPARKSAQRKINRVRFISIRNHGASSAATPINIRAGQNRQCNP